MSARAQNPLGWLTAAALGLGLVFGAAVESEAQDREGWDPGKRPLLGDHRFIPNNLTRDPFPRTFVRNTLGIGQAVDIEFLPAFEIGEGDTIQAISGDLLFALLDFEYQYAVKDWMAVWAKVNIVGRLGTDVGALLSEGATVLSGFELGWLIRLVETEKVALSATANLWNNSFTGLNFLDWVQGIVDDEPVELVRKIPSVRGGGGLRFAWAASDLIGVTATTELGYGESIARRGEDEVSFNLGAVADLDLYARTSVPLGFALGFETTNAPREGSSLTDKVSKGLLRIAYTGRDDFIIAIDNNFSRLSFEEGDPISSGSIVLNMRYYF